jgi:hypothetical protein
MGSSVVWSDHLSLLIHGIDELYRTGKGADLVIKCHEREFRVHKFVLNLFTDYFSACDGVWIRINTSAHHMEKMLYFLYHGQVRFNRDVLFSRV